MSHPSIYEYEKIMENGKEPNKITKGQTNPYT